MGTQIGMGRERDLPIPVQRERRRENRKRKGEGEWRRGRERHIISGRTCERYMYTYLLMEHVKVRGRGIQRYLLS